MSACDDDIQYISPIKRGYVWRLPIVFAGPDGDVPMVPDGSTYRAEVRAKASDATAIAVLTSANGGVVRVSDTELQLVLSPVQTGAIPAGVASVVTSLARTDVDPAEHFDFLLSIDVWSPPTRPA